MRLPVLAVLITALPLSAAFAQTSTLPAGHPPMGAMSAPSGKVEMNHTGTVQETLAASPYVYVRVKTSDGEQWLAAPAVELKPGAAVRWPDGMAMKNWFSKTLNKSFDTVYFVSAVQPDSK